MDAQPERLARSIGLFPAVLYGLGITIGAGIYVLVGLAAGRAGAHAPLAFLVAALVMVFSAASFAELGTRMPVAASEAASGSPEALVKLPIAIIGAPLRTLSER
jgi:amino acid transporter